MAIGGLLPVSEGLQTIFDGSTLGSSYKVYTYEAGTSTPLATYPTYDDAVAQTNANANPTVADSDGRVAMWGSGTTAYKVVVKTAADVTVKTIDDCYILPGATFVTSKTPSEYQIAFFENVSGSYSLTNAQTEDSFDFKYSSDGITLGSNKRMFFRDTGKSIRSVGSSSLDITSDGLINIVAGASTSILTASIWTLDANLYVGDGTNSSYKIRFNTNTTVCNVEWVDSVDELQIDQNVVVTGGTIATQSEDDWDLNDYSAGTPAASTGAVRVDINGTTYYLEASTSAPT